MADITYDDLDKKILNFIQDNPGKSKEEIVKAMKGNPSRITVLNHIRSLAEDHTIVLVKDKPNSPIYQIYVNEDDIKASLYVELAQIKASYSNLLDASLLQLESIEAKFRGLDEDVQWPWIRKCLKDEENLLTPLLQIYILILNVFAVVKTYQWHKEISNKETISDMYMLVHRFLQEMQEKLFVTTKQLYLFRNYDENEMSFDLLDYNIRPDLKSFSRMLETFQSWQLEREFSPVMGILWKMTYKSISLDNYPFLKLKKKERTDWRKILPQLS